MWNERRMFEDVVPKRKLGLISPLSIIDASAYEFYQIVPPGVMAVMAGLGLTEFSAADAERIFAPLEALADKMVVRDVDMLMQSGLPPALLLGVEGHDRMVARLAARTNKPASSTILALCSAAKHLGLKNIVVANKWSDEMNATLAAFFARAGVRIAGVVAELKIPSEYTKMGMREYLDLGYQLGRAALLEHPEADGLYLGGGAGLVQPAVEDLEREFGKPVLSNQNAMIWEMLHRVDYWIPMPTRGRLLAS
jgi:maleate cis-trans isomerase